MKIHRRPFTVRLFVRAFIVGTFIYKRYILIVSKEKVEMYSKVKILKLYDSKEYTI